MKIIDPNDYDTIQDYADALPDHDGFFGKQKTLSTFEILRKQKDAAFRMFYQKMVPYDSETNEKAMAFSMESFWIAKDGRIITDIDEIHHCQLRSQLQIMLDQIDDATNITKETSFDDHVSTSRTDFTFTIGNNHYSLETSAYIDPSLTLQAK